MASNPVASEALLSENMELRGRVAELERQLHEQQRREAALSASARVLQSIVDTIPYAIYWKDTDLVYQGCNQHFAADLGLASTRAVIGRSDAELPWRPEEVEGFRAIDRRVIESNTPEHDTDETTIHADGTQEWFETHKIPLHDEDGNVVGVLGTYANITERRRAEEAIRQSSIQQEIIAAQQAALRELSTPLIPIMDGVVAMPLIGAIDSARAQQIMETLLEGIGLQHANIAILDITGVRVVDMQVANALIRTAQAAQLLGARVVLTGITPEVAQTLVQLGVELSSVTTRSTLQSGIAYALAQRIR
ncbi:MAG TPA: PAS domain-containing protein [Roseiflexaceae bacterium]|nr:PAS domain-containing protein [Roseiflexaceae bacterium]